MGLTRLLLVAVVIASVAGPASAQLRRPRAELTPLVESEGVRAGGPVRLALRVSLPEGVHTQSNKPRDPLLIPTVLTFDPKVWPERDRYLRLAGADATGRIQLVEGGGEGGPRELGWQPDLLFIDGSHDRDLTIRTFETWRPALAPDAIVAFHDYGNPAYPGVGEAIAALRLDGEAHGDLFIWRALSSG